MLLNLQIRDFAIVDSADIALPPGFTVVTGETGAGKSILVDALILAMGGRANHDVIRQGAQTAEVQALFDISMHPLISQRLRERDLVGDDPNLLLVRRVVGIKGRAKVVINGQLSTVATLGELLRGLVEISSQHEQQTLLMVEQHLAVLDAYAQLNDHKAALVQAHSHMRQLQSKLRNLQQQTSETQRRVEVLNFLLADIAQISPQAGEEEQLNSERERLSHGEKLQVGAEQAEAWLYGQDGSIFDQLSKVKTQLQGLVEIDANLQPTYEAIDQMCLAATEVSRTLQQYSHHIDMDPARLADIETRLAALARLKRQHGGSIAAILSRQEELQTELETLTHADSQVAALSQALQQAEEQVLTLAIDLSLQRQQACKQFDAAIIGEVADMDLPQAVFYTHWRSVPAVANQTSTASQNFKITQDGCDDIEFLWSANPGEAPRPLARIASGGELSRLMLAVKRVLCNRDLVSVYVFDEVDTGLGGKAADSIGRKIAAVAQNHQAIAITHLAPIAARADHHLYVRKITRDTRTVSGFEQIDKTARIEEIARMIDGANITQATRQAARAMLLRN